MEAVVALAAIALRLPMVFAADYEAGGEAATQSAPRILIVEDEYLVAAELETSLAEAGFAVIGIAATAADAIRLARAEHPTLIVMDIRLAGRRDGITAAIEIYRETGIRCIFATAYAEPQMRQRAAAVAPLGWLAKPYQAEALIALIRDALRELRQ
jgi:two-component system, response regulator PdtaR